MCKVGNTVEPPNKGQVGAWTLVHYSEVVLIGYCGGGGGGGVVKAFFLYHIGNIDIFYV